MHKQDAPLEVETFYRKPKGSKRRNREAARNGGHTAAQAKQHEPMPHTRR